MGNGRDQCHFERPEVWTSLATTETFQILNGSGLLPTQPGVASNAADVLDVEFLLEQVNITSGTWYGAVDLTNAFFKITIKKGYQK